MKKITMVLALGLLVTACGDDEAADTTATSTTTTAAETTTVAPPTTAAPTTTVAPTTTAAPTTTSTTTTIPAPTFGFYTDGFGIVGFGATPDEVIAALDPLFGPPGIDSGWMNEPLCPGPEFRFFQYSDVLFDFRVLFTTGALFRDDGVGHFFTFNYQGDTPVPVTPPHLTVGTTVAELEALHPGVVYQENPFLNGVMDYVVAGNGENEQLYGQLTGTSPSDTVTSVQGGIGCGE
jgi:hypothetical protein